MKTTLLLLLPVSLFLLITTSVFAQQNEKSTIIGNPNTNERAMNLVADNAGSTYVGGQMEKKGLIVKQNAAQQVQWSKSLSYTSNPADEVSIAFLDLVGDTVFGCGKIHQGNQGIGSFYFKMNAQTGTLYWSKHETSGANYFSAMRYAHGKFFLVGGEYGTNIRGRALSVSSQTGNIIWQTPCMNYTFPSNAPNHGVHFLGATEMVNGKMFITGTAETYNNGGFYESVPILVGLTETGNIFLNRYFAFPASGNHEFKAGRIEYDSDKNLVLGIYNTLGGVPGLTYSVFLKCDTLGSVLYSKFYAINPCVAEFINQINETATGYTLFGYYNSVIDGMFTMKISKTGILEKCISITKPNTFYVPDWNSGFVSGNSSFINGNHYFPLIESTLSAPQTDINQIILDENLDYIADCSEITEIFPTTEDVQTNVNALVVVAGQNPLTITNGGVLQDQLLIIPCSDISLNLEQTQHCGLVDVSAVLTGFTDPTFYWSNGTIGNADTITVNTTDTIFVRVLDTKCCELSDTIVPFLTTYSFSMSLPNDTVVCLQNGNSYTITPSFSGANGAVTYLWSNNSTGSSLNVTQTGTYWVDISDNCTTLRDSITIVVNSLPVIGNTMDVGVCTGNFPVTLNPTVSNGATVLWDNGTTVVSRSVNGPGLYTFSATNNCGTANASISVIQINPPDVQLIASIDSCIQNGNAIPLVPTYSDATSLLWSDGSTGNQLMASNSGTYTVNAFGVCGVDSATCFVTINYFPELNLPAVLDTCFEIGVGFSYTAQGSGGTYQWSSGSQTATEWISQEGIYAVTLTNQCGSITDSMEVSRMAIPDLYFPEDSISICEKKLPVSLLYIETNYDLEILAPFHGTVENDLEETGWYTIHAFNGCWDKWDSIYVDLQEEIFYLPNSFTPNGDSNNDRFEFEGENVGIHDIRIYNRWGEEIFSETGAFNGWDGKYQGENCPDGVYVVQLVYEDCFGMPTEFTGHVTLIR